MIVNSSKLPGIYQINGRAPMGTEPRHILRGKRVFLGLKRAADIILSIIIIAGILSWALPILAILIRLDSAGPIFFRQRRVGYLGKTFTCYKLRTMYANADADTQQATEKDPRITAIGRLLRKPGLDELPQFINVLMGHMSIVGPRPHMLKDNSHFASLLPSYRFRSLMKPGITGMSQVMGCRGSTDSFDAIYRRFQWDVYYIKNASIRLDSKIVFRTLRVMASNLPRKPMRTAASAKIRRFN